MSTKAKKPTAPVKKAPPKKKGYKLPDPIKNGEIVRDLLKKEWQIGPSIGVGGFGEIYSATDVLDSPRKKASYPYVVKIEPHINGPLFVEMHFYMKVAKPADIDAWMKAKKLKSFGMPRYLGSGSHDYNGQKYRFVVIDRYGKDLWSLFLENKRIFPYPTVLRIALQVIDILEYIHSKSYVHADIKGSNLLLGLQKGTENQVFLVDFGLASHFTQQEFKPDPKKAHNGTIEYTSRDAHMGVTTRRGDMEILGYNMLQWLASKLPWEDCLSDPARVQQLKTQYLDDVPGLMKRSFPKSSPPGALVKYFEYVTSMKHNDEPDYTYCRKLFEKGLKDCKCPLEGKLEFTGKSLMQAKSQGDTEDLAENDRPIKQTKKQNQAKVRKQRVKASSDSDDNSGEEEQSKVGKMKRTLRRNETKLPKENVNGVSSDSDGNSGKERQRYVPEVDRSKFVYRAGEYKRLPPELRPYKFKKQRKE